MRPNYWAERPADSYGRANPQWQMRPPNRLYLSSFQTEHNRDSGAKGPELASRAPELTWELSVDRPILENRSLDSGSSVECQSARKGSFRTIKPEITDPEGGAAGLETASRETLAGLEQGEGLGFVVAWLKGGQPEAP